MGARRTADIAIIGGGIAGMSLAAAIGDRACVMVLEAEERLFHHTSSRSAQQMQPTYGPEPVRRLTAASIPIVAGIAERLGTAIFTPRPLLWLHYGDDAAPFAQLLATVPGLRRIGADQAIDRLPALCRDLLRDAGIDDAAVEVDVPILLAAYRDTAVRAGAEVLTGGQVTAIARLDRTWRLTTGAGETVEARTVVNAAGAWAEQVGALAGAAPLGLIPRRRTVAVARATGRTVDPGWPMAADAADTFYFRPRGDSVLASVLEDVRSEPEDAQPQEETVRTILQRVNAVTDLALADPHTTWTGLRTVTADHLPIVGTDPLLPGFYWLAGQGGYGIQTSAALAAAVAAELIGRPHDLPDSAALLQPLRPERLSLVARE
ncbi:NAD(P)/FAD-dependent oxidoreductase [uncultured Amnibacterium sp.]|uniref:NAD(P)/FAD-dependent oxidoreductase n=1 Tax=uncultured Amnibacterium sp. TaxID=1631851 RepID=UPI0035CAD2AA